MITKWNITNFKCFKEQIELPLGRLTVLAGANNSGKSTLISSILLVSQALTGRKRPGRVSLNGHLVQQGRIMNFINSGSETVEVGVGWECGKQPDGSGPMATLYHQEEPMAPGWKRSRSLAPGTLTCDLVFGTLVKNPFSVGDDQPPVLSLRITCSGDDDHTPGAELALARMGVDEATFSIAEDVMNASRSHPDDDSYLYELRIDDESLSELDSEFIDGELEGCTFKNIFPMHLRIRFDKCKQEAAAIELALIATTDPKLMNAFWKTFRHLGFSTEVRIPAPVISRIRKRLGEGDQLVPDNTGGIDIAGWRRMMHSLSQEERLSLSQVIGEMFEDEIEWNSTIREIESGLSEPEAHEATPDDESRPEGDCALTGLPAKLSRAVSYQERYFTEQVKYLGPLRDDFKSRLPESGSADLENIGLRGERAADIFDLKLREQVAHVPPENFTQPEIKLTARTDMLAKAVGQWLSYLGLAEGAWVANHGAHGHRMAVSPTGESYPRDISTMGAGVRQVLPVLIMCLLAEKDSTLIVEQPELHLHPMSQARLADFFLSMMLVGKQCIIETHSEHLIDRLNFRSAANISNRLPDAIKSYFVEQDEKGSLVREMPLSAYKDHSTWPENFYDLSHRDEENILRSKSESWDQELGSKETEWRRN